MPRGTVIVGGGQAGFECAATLRAGGYGSPVTIVNDEPNLPYQRPPLSKGFLLGKQTASDLELRPAAFYPTHDIALVRDRAAAVIPGEHTVRLQSGGQLEYDALVLATGGRPRTLPVEGATAEGVFYLRTLDDASAIRARIEAAGDVVVIGGGFIGLEGAAVAATLGCRVTVIEAQPRLMARAVAPMVSEFFRTLHSSRGVSSVLGADVECIVAESGCARAVRLRDGRTFASDLVLVGIGIVPNSEVASAAGLQVSDGIVVDAHLRTSAVDIFAIGDCAFHPNRHAAGKRLRLESIQNASDQARCAAAAILGSPAEYNAVPWFWTDQYNVRLQMAGLSDGYDQVAVRGDQDSLKFSTYYFKRGALIAVDSINRPADHIVARKLLAAERLVTPALVSDATVDLKTLC